MKSDQDDDLLDRLIRAMVEKPIPNAPPENVRLRVLALGDRASPSAPTSRRSTDFFITHWVRVAAIAAALLFAIDLGWWHLVHTRKPVCWYHNPETGIWHVMYADTRVEISHPPPHVSGNSWNGRSDG
jgi:hypothetical protein